MTPEKYEAICDAYSTGVAGYESCAERLGVPGSTAFDHKELPENNGRYTRARTNKMHWLFEEMHRLQNMVPPTDDSGRTDTGWVTWRKNQVSLLQWTLARLFPKEFGDYQKVEHSGSVAFSGRRVLKLTVPKDDDEQE
jgi:hypothetical protein